MGEPVLTRIEPDAMREWVARLGHEDTPHVYSDRRALVRWLFWGRLEALMRISRPPSRGRVLDFGGGNGVLLPTLSARYDSVCCVDLRPQIAHELVRAHGLHNVEVHAGDLPTLGLAARSFDTIVASDVLEHVTPLEPVLEHFVELLVPGGEVLTTSPTENRFYELGRRVFGYVKPHDHYRDADDVDGALASRLHMTDRRYFPIDFAPLGVFTVARFCNAGDGR